MHMEKNGNGGGLLRCLSSNLHKCQRGGEPHG